MVEGLIAIAVLALFWLSIGWLGRHSDIGLSAQHASNFAAFAYARAGEAGSTPVTVEQSIARHFDGPAHHWRDLHGRRILMPVDARTPGQAADGTRGGGSVGLTLSRKEQLSHDAQPGGGSRNAAALRAEWSTHDNGILIAEAAGRSTHAIFGNVSAPVLARRTAILVGAGHAVDDAAVSRHLGRSHLAWQLAARPSLRVGHSLRPVLMRVEQGWRRPSPTFDWISPWAGQIPPGLVQRRPAADHAQTRFSVSQPRNVMSSFLRSASYAE